MAITAKTDFEPRDLVPEGNYFGVCIGVYDIGTQPSDKYNPTHKVILQFELHKKKGVCRTKDNKPLTISGFYPLAFGMNSKTRVKAKLRQAVEGILGRTFSDAEAKTGYDITQLLEMGCRLKVAHDKDDQGNATYDHIETYMPLDEDDPKVEPESSCYAYELEPQYPIPDDVPKWVARQIEKSIEWTRAHGQPANGNAKVGNGKAAAKVGNGKATAAPPASGDDDDDEIPF